jgi:NAD(P) transhydrogenase subunit alpha
MKIAVPAEADKLENRVAATPETVKKLIAFGAKCVVQEGAGLGSRIFDVEYEAAGVTVLKTAAATLKDADIVLLVRRPAETDLAHYKYGAVVIATMDPFGNEAAVKAMAEAIRQCPADDDDGSRHGAGGARLRHGGWRRRPAGYCHRPSPRRLGHRD